MLTLETPRLRLINVSKEIIHQFLEGEKELAAFLGINIPGKWTEFGDAKNLFGFNKKFCPPVFLPSFNCFIIRNWL